MNASDFPPQRARVPVLRCGGNRLKLAAILAVAFLAAACASLNSPSEALRFSAPEGRALNEFFRQGPVAAHLVLTSGSAPRLVIAFPAGNSGAALWFKAPAAVSWRPDVTIVAAHRDLPGGGVLHGVTAKLVATGGPITVMQAIASSVRVIRDYQDAHKASPEILVAPRVSANSIVWERRRLDGAPGYSLSIEVTRGAIAGGEARLIELTPDAEGELHLSVTALTGDAPLRPFEEDELVTSAAASDARLRHMLAFLSYEQKLLAGSWRFNTYFGRDTLMSLRLLAPVLRPRVFEAGLGAVLERLNAVGEVAHEEDIGEYAVLRRIRAGEPPSDSPVLDYKMIDDDFMLPVIVAHYLLDIPEGRARAAAFLARRTGAGETYGAALVRNLNFAVAMTTPFASDPYWRRLIALKAGEHVGNWRDSEDGLGGGRYPYDVNGVLAPAALEAIARLHESGVLKTYLDQDADERLSNAAAMAQVWRREAPRLFDVTVTAEAARLEAETYARRIGVDPSPAVAAVGAEMVRFRAVSLDAYGRPVPILNSDEAFALMFLDDAPADVERIADTLTRPFPAGLLTDVGLLVANPAYAADELEPTFDRNRYHGTVIWSWQQALFAAGVDRQLDRTDLTASARTALQRARSRLHAAIAAADALRGSELWSWSQIDGRYRIEPFGQREGDETESNAAQLWSTVQLRAAN
jgi:hypothetical protein